MTYQARGQESLFEIKKIMLFPTTHTTIVVLTFLQRHSNVVDWWMLRKRCVRTGLNIYINFDIIIEIPAAGLDQFLSLDVLRVVKRCSLHRYCFKRNLSLSTRRKLTFCKVALTQFIPNLLKVMYRKL